MGTFRFPADLLDDPRWDTCGSDSAAFYMAGLAYCHRLSTDGWIPPRAARRLFPVEDPDSAIKKLIDAGWWREVDRGYEVIDYLSWNKSKVQVERQCEVTALRQQAFRDKTQGKSAPINPDEIDNGDVMEWFGK